MNEPRGYDLSFSRWESGRRLAAQIGVPVESTQPVIRDRYRLDERIGAGTFGSVYRARDLALHRDVAIKTLAPTATQEAILLAKLHHTNVVAIYDCGTEGGCGFIVTELLRGPTLTSWQRAEQPDRRQIISVYSDAGRGLAAAHQAGVVHRDFKPDNVVICGDGRVVVVDFGIAMPADQHSPTSVGTLAYMAPEQLVDRGRITAASDQFSFCVALWETLMGASPFSGSEAATRLASIISGPQGPAPSGRIGRALLRGLARSPADRWPSMADLLTELAQLEHRRERRPRLLAVGIGLALVVAFGLLPLGPSTPPALAHPEALVEEDLTIASLTDRAVQAAEDGSSDQAAWLLDVAEFRSNSDTEGLLVAAAADAVGLKLYERQLWVGSILAHSRARNLYEQHRESELSFRSLELARAADAARLRSM